MSQMAELDAIEKEIIVCLQSAGQALAELSKEKSSQKTAENHTAQFLKSLNLVETKLSEQIKYLTNGSTALPHEGSGYASAKVLQMAWHRIHHAKSRVRELEESKIKFTKHNAARSSKITGNTGTLAQQQQQQQQQHQQQLQQLQQQQQQQQSIQPGANVPTGHSSI